MSIYCECCVLSGRVAEPGRRLVKRSLTKCVCVCVCVCVTECDQVQQ